MSGWSGRHSWGRNIIIFQNCGRFYSSEWNLDRHRREICPTKLNTDTNSPNAQNDDVSIIIGSCRFILPRTALTKASSAFTSLFLLHDPAKGDLRLEGDPMDFQNLLDVYNDPLSLNRANVDQVLLLAEQYKFSQVTDTCAKFIENEVRTGLFLLMASSSCPNCL